MDSVSPGIFVMCQAGDFQQLFFVDAEGNIEKRDAATILGRLKCSPSTPIASFPANYNASVMKVYRQFAEEVAHRKTLLERSSSLTGGQSYLLQELKPFAAGLDEDDPRKSDVSILQRAFGSHGLSPAVQTELRRVKSHKLTGEALFKRLREIYDQHKMSQMREEAQGQERVSIPQIICSEALAG